MLAAEAGLHAPDRKQRPGRHAVSLLDVGEHRRLRLPELPTFGDDRRRAALDQELIERKAEAALPAIGVDGRLRVGRPHQRGEAGAADAFCPGFT